MARLAIIKNNKVTNVIIADLDWPEKHIVLDNNSVVSIGWLWDGETFTAPKVEIVYKTTFNSKDLLNTFTYKEVSLARTAGGNIEFQYQILVDRTKTINNTDPEYISALAEFLTARIITQERHDELLKGIPV